MKHVEFVFSLLILSDYDFYRLCKVPYNRGHDFSSLAGQISPAFPVLSSGKKLPAFPRDPDRGLAKGRTHQMAFTFERPFPGSHFTN